ncbi:hypothetical protein U9M48_005655 [Paspalum notatum var. saurae]|uniref:non-specific serine/threonine protein kinase n=1 Tax=Paspalum notatum var. saurae TaxID=547442 RepID=A0AAQ3PY53_PASNO
MGRHCLLLRLVFLSVVSAASAYADFTADEFIYNGFFGSDLSLDNQALVSDGLLKLTDGVSSKGHAFYTFPLNFSSPEISNTSSSVPSFSTTFVFAIVSYYQGFSTDGLAFVLSSSKNLSSGFEDSQYLGLVDSLPSSTGNKESNHHLLAIEFDTIQNPELEDIDDNHIGIDVNSPISINSHTAGYYASDGTFYKLSLAGGEPMQVWVDYDSKHTILNITIAHYSLSSTKPNRPLISITYDLSSVLPNTSSAYAGFSSACGPINTRHYILGWSFNLSGEAAALNYSALSLNTIRQELAQQVRLPRDHSLSKKTILLCAILLPTLGIAMIISATIVKAHMDRLSESRTAEIEWDREYVPPSFTYKDLLAATGGFEDKMLLGRGGFGSVFRGVLRHSKKAIAIKRVAPESKQGMKEFVAEIVILGHLRHRNLVQLLGYCRHKQQLLLVYDYMPNTSLDYHLHTQQPNTTNLSWSQRFHIIRGIASGLFYLHEDWEQVVIHRDIKTSNVLLDSEMNARLGDFGLARSHDHGADAHTTRVAGTWGYIAPELARLGKATKATDVFAFGVLMMEVTSARRPIWVDSANGEPLALADWVLAAWQGGSITDAVDPRLDTYVEEEVDLVLKLGLLCSHPSPEARPCMRLVMQYLQRDTPLPADLQPDTLLSICVSHDDDEHPMSCPATAITDLSKGR